MFQTTDKNRKALGYWLLFVAFTVALMVVVGGATRLTESGLSIVEWKPITGTVPPLSDTEWQSEFSKYQQSPEYKLKNQGMSLEEFKDIFYWEWGHRLLGRLIGVFFAVPLLYFWVKGQIPQGYKPRLVGLLFLGGAQGALGWYMVMSGLIDEPAVSHYRLTAHLGLALFIFSALLWTALSLLNPKPASASKGFKFFVHGFMSLLVLQLLMGALVAGLKAGHIFNTWPLMGETFVPEGLTMMEPFWLNFLDNAITVQFDHRMGAYIIAVLAVCIFVLGQMQQPAVKRACYVVFGAVSLQITLGIVTLVLAVPVFWGTAHQGGGVLLLAATISLMHTIRKREAR